MITYLSQNLVTLDADELPLVVEMNTRQLTSLEQFRREPAPNLHNGLEHLVVAVSSEQDLACVQLVQGAADGPHVDRVVVRDSQNNLWRSIESTDKVRRNVHMRCCCIRLVDGRSQVTDLEHVAALIHLLKSASCPLKSVRITYQNVVGLEISMDDTALPHMC